jgi:phosphoribosylformylglycinamidine (FGAM) synthase PurS component
MKAAVELWVRLKVTDLVTQTASITLIEKLDFADRLRGLVHYSYWGMEADGADPRSILSEIDRVIRLDGAFTNQNKHYYRLFVGETAGSGIRKTDRGAPAARETADGAERSRAGVLSTGDLPLERDFPMSSDLPPAAAELFAVDCLIRERRPDREIGYAERLGSRLRGVAVSNLRFGDVWRLIVAAPSRERALADIERMVVSRSRREGLLLNPHYQKYEIIATAPLAKPGDAEGSALRRSERS